MGKREQFRLKPRSKQSIRRQMLRHSGLVTIDEKCCWVAYRGKVIPAGPFEHAVVDESGDRPVLALKIPPGTYHDFRALMRKVNGLWAKDGFRLHINNDRSMEAVYIGKRRDGDAA